MSSLCYSAHPPSHQSRLIGFDNRNHFSGHGINLSHRRSGTSGAKELFISTLERGVCFGPICGRLFSARLAGALFLSQNEGRSHERLLEFDRYCFRISARRTFKSSLVVIDLVGRLNTRKKHRQSALRTSPLTNGRVCRVEIARLRHNATLTHD